MISKSPIPAMASYLSTLPQDLINSLFLYFPSNELIRFMEDPKRSSLNISFNSYFWTSVWRRDISSLVDWRNRSDDPYAMYKSVFEVLHNSKIYRKQMQFLARNGYDKLLYSILEVTPADKWNFEKFHEAVQSAIEANHVEIINYCMSQGYRAYDDMMITAARYGRLNIIKMMIEKGAKNFDAAMTWAVTCINCMEIIDLMLEKGAKSYGATICSAIMADNREVVHKMLQLIDKDIESYPQDRIEDFYRTYIHMAIKNRNQSIRKLLQKFQRKHVVSQKVPEKEN